MVLITGSSGFVGTALKKVLQNEFITISRKPTQNHNSINLDLTNLKDLLLKLESKPIKQIIHLAATTYNNNKSAQFDQNITMMQNLIELAKQKGNIPIIYISTFAASYKNDPYAKTKKLAEELLQKSGIPHTIIRPTMIIGEGSKDLEKFKNIIKYGIVPLIENGKQQIQPIHIDEVTHWINHFLNQTHQNKKYIISGKQRIKTRDFLNQLSNKKLITINIPKALVLNSITKLHPPTYELMKTFIYDLTPETIGVNIRKQLHKQNSTAHEIV